MTEESRDRRLAWRRRAEVTALVSVVATLAVFYLWDSNSSSIDSVLLLSWLLTLVVVSKTGGIASFALALLSMRWRGMAAGLIALAVSSLSCIQLARTCGCSVEENRGIAGLRAINVAESSYLSVSGGSYGSVEDLVKAGLLENHFTANDRYRFAVVVNAKDPTDYVATARPVSPPPKPGPLVSALDRSIRWLTCARPRAVAYEYVSFPDGIIRYSLDPSSAPPSLAGQPVN